MYLHADATDGALQIPETYMHVCIYAYGRFGCLAGCVCMFSLARLCLWRVNATN